MTGRERERNLRRAVRLLLGQMEKARPVSELSEQDDWSKAVFIASRTLEVCEKDVGIRR